jgi:hypothetical protein
MTDVGTYTKGLITALATLIGYYLTTSNSLPHDSPERPSYYIWAYCLVAVWVVVATLEVARTFKLLDEPKWAKVPKLNLIFGVLSFAIGLIGLVALHDHSYAGRKLDTVRQDELKKAAEQKLSLDKQVAETECESRKSMDVDALTKRRKAAFAEKNRCLADWTKPSIFSTETAAAHCAAKIEAYGQLAGKVKERLTSVCGMK